MTNEEKIRQVFRKHPESRYKRALTYWWIGRDFYDFAINGAPEPNLMLFFRDFSGIERSVRQVLKEPEFNLGAEEDKKRYEKAESFRKEYSRI
jgi:hypothetical protein